MNDPIFLEASRKLAERLLARPAEERIPLAVRIVLTRGPRPAELQVLSSARTKISAYYESHPTAAADLLKQGDSPRDVRYSVTEAATWTAVASILLNMDEAVTKE